MGNGAPLRFSRASKTRPTGNAPRGPRWTFPSTAANPVNATPQPAQRSSSVPVLDYTKQGQHHDHENDHHYDGDYAVGVHATSPEISELRYVAIRQRPT